LGVPALRPTELAGRVDMPIPVYRYQAVAARVLGLHTDVFTAQNTLQKARYNLRLAQISPIPDVDVIVRVQKDYTTSPFNVTPSVQVGVPVPLWNQNRGGIIQAQGSLLRAVEESHRVRDDLSQRLAAAFEDYQNNRQLLEYY